MNEQNKVIGYKVAPQQQAIYFRLPKPGGRCPISGLSRTSLVELCLSGRVKFVRLKQGTKKRGVTLVNRQSFLDFLKSQEQ